MPHPISFALDLIHPPRCLMCQEPVMRIGGVCVACWGKLVPLVAPRCRRCGQEEVPGITLHHAFACTACENEWQHLDEFYAMFRYVTALRDSIVRYKRTYSPEHNLWFHRMLAAALPRFSQPFDLVVPVPLHPSRLLNRRFNQSCAIIDATELPWATGRAAHPDDPIVESGKRLAQLLRVDVLRRRLPGTQKGLTRKQRIVHLDEAFHVSPRHKDAVAGRRVLLIDDVVTTGATLNSCAHALKRAGATRVMGWSIAQVPKHKNE